MLMFTFCYFFCLCVLKTQGLGRLSQYAIAQLQCIVQLHNCSALHNCTIAHPVYCTNAQMHNCTIAHLVYCTNALHTQFIAQLHTGRWQCPNDKCRELTVQLFGRGHHSLPRLPQLSTLLPVQSN